MFKCCFYFSSKIGVLSFSFPFFDEVPNFHTRTFINQSEAEIADTKLSVELYDDQSLIHQLIVSSQ